MMAVLGKVLPVITMLLIGAFARRRKIISETGIESIKAFVVNFTLPATLFGAFWAMSFTWREFVLLLIMAAVTAAAFWLGHIVPKYFGVKNSILPYLCTSIEGGSIGYALTILLLGQENLYRFALLDVGNALVQWGFVIPLLQMHEAGELPGKERFRALINPVNAAIAAGVLFSVTGIGPAAAGTAAGQVIDSVLAFVGGPTGAVIIMTLGYSLVFKGINWIETAKGMLSRAVIYAGLCLLTLLLLPLVFPGDAMYRLAVILFFTMPPTYAYLVFTKDEEERRYLSSFTTLYTVLTILAFIVIVAITV